VFGRVQNGPFVLTRADLDRRPAEDHVPDVAAYAKGETGKAVSLKSMCDLAKPLPGTLYVNFENRTGAHCVSHFLTEVQDLGWISYEIGDEIHSGERSGTFRLILPGIPAERGRMDDLACIEFADEPMDPAVPAERRSWAVQEKGSSAV